MLENSVHIKKLMMVFCTWIFVCVFVAGMEAAEVEVRLPVQQADATTAENQIVRAYYSDQAMLNFVAERHDMEETPWNQDEQYVVLITTSAERDMLRDVGFELIVSDPLTQELQREENGFSGVQSRDINDYACYRSVEDMIGIDGVGERLATDYPKLAEWVDIGDSWKKENGQGGHDLMVLRLTNEEIDSDKSKAFFVSGVHAREYATTELNARFAEHLLKNYGIDPDITALLDHHEVHLLLQANPDGRIKAEDVGEIFYRKNGNMDACGGTDYYDYSWRHGGVDLNRNYSFGWAACGDSKATTTCSNIEATPQSGSSTNACSSSYRGTAPNSEPEIEAIQDHIKSLFPDQRGAGWNAAAPDDTTGMFIDIHTFGRELLYPWGNNAGGSAYTSNDDQFKALARKLTSFNGYTPKIGTAHYTTDGSSKDFGYGELGIPSLVVELDGNGAPFEHPYDEYYRNFFLDCDTFNAKTEPDNREMLIYAVKASRAPYQLPFGPDVRDVQIESFGDVVQLSAEVDDTAYNELINGETQATQNVVAAEYYIDTPPWVSHATGIPMQLTGSLAKKRQAMADIDTTGLAEGQHLIYVHGQDADGNWGPVTAQFLTIENNSTGNPENPWQAEAGTPTNTNRPWDFALGYHFTPQVDGYVTELGGYFNGTKTVRLFDRTAGDFLAGTEVTSSNDWSYSAISPIAVDAGGKYSVVVYMDGSGGSYQSGVNYPLTSGNIQIDGTTYIYTSSNPEARPTRLVKGVMYGQADITFEKDLTR